MKRSRFAAILLIVLAPSGCAPKADEAVATDGRTVITAPPAAAEAIWMEMRTMLTSVQAIVAALPAGDTATMHGAATMAGTAAAADTALEAILPAEFLSLGMATHRGFDSLGTAIGAGAPRDSILTRLGRVLSNCVGCHAQYRLVSAPRS